MVVTFAFLAGDHPSNRRFLVASNGTYAAPPYHPRVLASFSEWFEVDRVHVGKLQRPKVAVVEDRLAMSGAEIVLSSGRTLSHICVVDEGVLRSMFASLFRDRAVLDVFRDDAEAVYAEMMAGVEGKFRIDAQRKVTWYSVA